MNGTILREVLQTIFPISLLLEQARRFNVIQRDRKVDLVALIISLVLNTGSDDSGRLADVYRRYIGEVASKVVRGAFYHWIDKALAKLLEWTLEQALFHVRALPVFLPGNLGVVRDWIIVDSETVTLRKALKKSFPSTSKKKGGIKIHKYFSVGLGCMVGYRLSSARENDNRNFEITEKDRGLGYLVDLSYASIAFIKSCAKYNVKFVIRLKENWQPRVTQVVIAQLGDYFFEGMNFRFACDIGSIILDDRPIDLNVVIGQGNKKAHCRLVGVQGPHGYLFYLTNLDRNTHTAEQVCELYRVRWEIELDNKVDKSTARLDQIRATTESSVKVLVYSSLLHTLLVDLLAYRDRIERKETQTSIRAPIHPQTLSHVINAHHSDLCRAVLDPTTPDERWEHFAELLSFLGRDPNWRSRPSVLDSLCGITAPPGRSKKKKFCECPTYAISYRRMNTIKKAA